MKELVAIHSPKAPTGSKFIIDRCPFVAGSSIEMAMLDIDEGRLYDWPMVYILANEEEAYVGQTTSVVRRMSQHGANPEKRAFNTANIIFNEEANMSVVTDYESRLIQYMSADGRYVLTNKNAGIVNSNYFSKAEYDAMFEELWEELRTMELVDHAIGEIEESEVFKYSPYKSLNEDQKTALWKITAAIHDAEESCPIVVEGMPGTGKTVLAVFLLKSLRDDPAFEGMSIKILEPVTSLRETLQRSLAGVRNLSKEDVLGPSDLAKFGTAGKAEEKPIDILLVDESHRLKQRKNIMAYKSFDDTSEKLGFERGGSATQLDWVLKQARIPVLFYDPMQVVGPSGIGQEIMEDRLGDALANSIKLESQMRVKGGRAYLEYIVDILWDRNPDPAAFEGYELVFHDDFKAFHSSFEQHLRAHSLTRMIAGYAWKWKTKKDSSPDAYDIEIDGIKIRWNCKQENWVGLGVDNPDVARETGVIHTIQGYDLSYAYVVIGGDLVYDEGEGKVTVNRAGYFDKNGKNTATDEELEEYIKHIYYVLMTRGVRGTHVYVCDEALRKHLAKYFV